MEHKKHIFLVDDELGAFEPGSTKAIAIHTLPGPKAGPPRKYMIADGALQELVRIGQPPSGSYSSWFIDQSVKQDGTLMVASRMEPLYLILPALDNSSAKFSSILQIASECSSTYSGLLLGLKGLLDSVLAVCDQKNGVMEGAHHMLVRLNSDKLEGYLSARVNRLALVLQERAVEAAERARASGQSFNASSSMAAKPAGGAGAAAGGSGAEAHAVTADVAHLESALSILGDYCADKWVAAVAQRHGVPLSGSLAHLSAFAPPSTPSNASSACAASAAAAAAADGAASPLPSSPSGSTASPELAAAAAWNDAAVAAASGHDPASTVEKYVRGASRSASPDLKDGGASGGKKKVSAPLTVQQKKLAGTNIKGMKPMTSFFGKS